jgi:hypothetical protein
MVNKSREDKRTDDGLDDPSIYGPQSDYVVQVKFKPSSPGTLPTDEKMSSKIGKKTSHMESVLRKYDVKLQPAFDESEESLMAKASKSKSEGINVPDLSRYYVAYVRNKDQAEKLAKELSKDESVDSTDVVPPPVPATVTITTVSFENLQGYLEPAPGGVDARYAWTFPGGKGTGINMIDIEGAWNFSHEDLLLNQLGLAGGTMNPDASWLNHGTAVIGEIGGDENNFGITGISSQCIVRGYSIFGQNNAFHLAMKNAADMLGPGDIILIELHAPGPDASGSGQDGYIAMEFWDINFDAIRYATSLGIIVVEAGGNGSRDLDSPVFQNKFSRSLRDSGAIVVGAGAPPSGNYGPDRSRLGFSNWGSIVDTQGWGREVVTTGYGDLQGGPDPNKWYTAQFSGTSSASPIIVGVIACLQGIRRARGEPPLTFTQIRNLLHTSGSLQQDAPGRPITQRIGNRPNLREMVNRLWPQNTIVDKITVRIKTGYKSAASTNGRVYLGIAGREFRLNKSGDQFQQGTEDEFIIGAGSNILNGNKNALPLSSNFLNDSPHIPFDSVSLYPAYIRFEPANSNDEWNVDRVCVSLRNNFGPTADLHAQILNSTNDDNIWLSEDSGLFIGLVGGTCT